MVGNDFNAEVLRRIGSRRRFAPTGVFMSSRANKIRESLSARNTQVFAALAGDIFSAYESGRTIKQLCQEYGLPEQRVRDILRDEKARSGLRH
jgi:hypothetical protein